MILPRVPRSAWPRQKIFLLHNPSLKIRSSAETGNRGNRTNAPFPVIRFTSRSKHLLRHEGLPELKELPKLAGTVLRKMIFCRYQRGFSS